MIGGYGCWIGLGSRNAAADLEEAALEVELALRRPEPCGRSRATPRRTRRPCRAPASARRTSRAPAGPAAHDVEREPAARDVVDRGGLLGRHDRVDRSGRARLQNTAVCRVGAEPRRPGEGLESRAVEIGRARRSRASARWARAPRCRPGPRAWPAPRGGPAQLPAPLGRGAGAAVVAVEPEHRRA